MMATTTGTPVGWRLCNTCKAGKPLDEFGSDKSQPSGKRYQCKACRSRHQLKLYHESPEKHRAIKRKSDAKYRVRRIAYNKSGERQATWFRWRLGTRFGITVDDFNAMMDSQGGVCAICGTKPGSTRLAVDHCHTDGRIRGLLCRHCNMAIGKFKDDAGLLRKAAEYLEQHSGDA